MQKNSNFLYFIWFMLCENIRNIKPMFLYILSKIGFKKLKTKQIKLWIFGKEETMTVEQIDKYKESITEGQRIGNFIKFYWFMFMEDMRNIEALFFWSLAIIGFKRLRSHKVKIRFFNDTYDFKVAHLGTIKEAIVEKGYELPDIGDSDIIDAGANYGIFRLVVQHYIPDYKGKYVAIEPDIFNVWELRHQPIWKYHKIIECALSNYDGETGFSTSSTGITSHITEKIDDKYIKIECHKIDTIVKKEKVKPGLLKIDVEGEDYNVLLGAEETIKEYKPYILIEIHDYLADNKTKCLDLLHSYGYITTFRGNNIWYCEAKK